MLYHFHEMNRALWSPWVHYAEATAKLYARDPFRRLPFAPRLAAGFDLVHRIGKDYVKPEFAIREVSAHGHRLPVIEIETDTTPFCRLVRFKRYSDDPKTVSDLKDDPKVLVVAPLSGHHATLLRDTVRKLLEDHKVWITDWTDARMVPADAGAFHLDDYIDTIRRFITTLGADDLHVICVCQPSVPVLAAISLMAAAGEKVPRSLTLMGGPIDTRRSPTKVNDLATTKPVEWFEQNVIHVVPQNYPGAGRLVYPGFLQHAGFVAMNPRRHARSHWDYYMDLVQGDLQDVEAHRDFYDEYNAVADLPAEYYLDTIRVVFQQHLLPRGEWRVRGARVDPGAIRNMGLLTIEGELDDISGLGQTEAAQTLCSGLATSRKRHLTIKGAGHYGIFSGRRWRDIVYPDVRSFIAANSAGARRATR
jgi:poly(3-hydroxybutyrate) depolymerase